MNQILDSATSGQSEEFSVQSGYLTIPVGGDFGDATVSLLGKIQGTNQFIPMSEGGEPSIWSEPLVKILMVTRPTTFKLVINGTANGIDAWS